MSEKNFIPEHICPECYREKPNHGPDCSLNKSTISEETTLQTETEEIETDSKTDTTNNTLEEENIIKYNNDVIRADSNEIRYNVERSPELEEKQKRIEKLREDVKRTFELSRGEMARLKMNSDAIFDLAEQKLSELVKVSSDPIITTKLEQLNNHRKIVGETFTSALLKLISDNNNMQDILQSIDLAVIPLEEIKIIEDSIERSIKAVKDSDVQLHNTIEQGIAHIKKQANTIPTVQDILRRR